MAGRVEGKVALITGGGSGIGRATALLFGREGAKVLVADYNAEGGERTVKTIKEAGGTAVFHAADVSNPQDVDALMHKLVETYGRLDCAFNNAGIEGQMGDTPECSFENWNRVIAINLTGVFLCMKYEIPLMLRHGGRAIVNTASAAGPVGLSGASAYVAAKHGVAGLTKTARWNSRRRESASMRYARDLSARRWSSEGSIKGIFSEEQIFALEPMHRMGKSDEIAEAVLWLCSDASSFVTGLPMPVDGGYVAQ
jgi:NAD(P)-dependent dehydrogenase (short-subunit alcohol dehydrogenase family)